MSIDAVEVRRIASLAQLEIEDGDLEGLRAELQAILDYVASLERIDLSGIPRFTHAQAGEPSLREDVPAPSLTADQALRLAADAAAGHFRVPRVLQG